MDGGNRAGSMTQTLSEVSWCPFGISSKSGSYICPMLTVESKVLLAETFKMISEVLNYVTVSILTDNRATPENLGREFLVKY